MSTGTRVEGILRQAADVEEVERRVQEYEQGFFFIQVHVIEDMIPFPSCYECVLFCTGQL